MKYKITQQFSKDYPDNGQFLVWKVPDEHYWPVRLVFTIGWSRIGSGYLTYEEALAAANALADSLPGSYIANECVGCNGQKTILTIVDNKEVWYPCFICGGSGQTMFDPRPPRTIGEDIPEMEEKQNE